MTPAFLVQTLISLIAIAALVGLAAWARIARQLPALDEACALRLLADEFPDRPIGQVWIAADSRSAVARSDDQALVLYLVGDGYVTRSVAWGELAGARAIGAFRELRLRDITAPRVRFAWPESEAWPPIAEEGAR